MEDAKIALVQFQISPPKTDIENNVVVSDYNQASGAMGGAVRGSPNRQASAEGSGRGRDVREAGLGVSAHARQPGLWLLAAYTLSPNPPC
jgi:hypothetical protein